MRSCQPGRATASAPGRSIGWLGSSATTRTGFRAASSRATRPVPRATSSTHEPGDRVHRRDEEPAPPRVLAERQHRAHPLVLGRDAGEDRRRLRAVRVGTPSAAAAAPGGRRSSRARGRASPRSRSSAGTCRSAPARPLMPARLRAEHVVHDVVADHQRLGPAATPRSASAASKYAGAGLPQIAAVDAGRLLETGDVRAAVELPALGRPPVQVAVHADERRAVHQPAEDAVHGA